MNRLVVGLVVPVQVVLFLVLLFIIIAATAASAQEVDRFSETKVSVPLFKSVVLELGGPAARISIGNPDVADILILKANQLYVLGKDLGTTNVILWDERDNLIGNVAVEVTHDLETLKEKQRVEVPSTGELRWAKSCMWEI